MCLSKTSLNNNPFVPDCLVCAFFMTVVNNARQAASLTSPATGPLNECHQSLGPRNHFPESLAQPDTKSKARLERLGLNWLCLVALSLWHDFLSIETHLRAIVSSKIRQMFTRCSKHKYIIIHMSVGRKLQFPKRTSSSWGVPYRLSVFGNPSYLCILGNSRTLSN